MLNMETFADYEDYLRQRCRNDQKQAPSATIMVEADEDLLQNAERILDELGLDIETYLKMSLRAVGGCIFSRVNGNNLHNKKKEVMK